MRLGNRRTGLALAAVRPDCRRETLPWLQTLLQPQTAVFQRPQLLLNAPHGLAQADLWQPPKTPRQLQCRQKSFWGVTGVGALADFLFDIHQVSDPRRQVKRNGAV